MPPRPVQPHGHKVGVLVQVVEAVEVEVEVEVEVVLGLVEVGVVLVGNVGRKGAIHCAPRTSLVFVR